MKMKVLFVGLVLASTARGVDIPFSQSFSLGPGETAFSLSLPQFDSTAHPATPFLQSVTVTLQATFSGGMTFFNESFSPISASGNIGNARLLVTPIGTGLLTPAPLNLGLAGASPVAAAVMSPDPDPTKSPPDAHRIDGESSVLAASSSSTMASGSTQGTLDAYRGAGDIAYDIDFTALYAPRVTSSPSAATCILCNDRVTGELIVTYTAAAAPPTGGVLDSFAAVWAGPGMVVLNWRTGVESNLLGFHLEREVAANQWQRVTSGMIPALGGHVPNDYRFEEADVPFGGMVKYRLVQVGTRGELIPLRETIVQVGLEAGIAMTPNGLQVSVQGAANSRVHVELSSDVARGPWIRGDSVILDGTGSGRLTLEVSSTEAAQFYRLIQE